MLRERLFEHIGLVLAISVLLMVGGVVLPFLMVIHALESTFFLNFLAYGMSVLGLMLGIVSIVSIRLKQKRKDDGSRNPYRNDGGV